MKPEQALEHAAQELLNALEKMSVLHHMWNMNAHTQAGQDEWFALKRAVKGVQDAIDDMPPPPKNN